MQYSHNFFKKVICTLLCLLLLVTFMPSFSFAKNVDEIDKGDLLTETGIAVGAKYASIFGDLHPDPPPEKSVYTITTFDDYQTFLWYLSKETPPPISQLMDKYPSFGKVITPASYLVKGQFETMIGDPAIDYITDKDLLGNYLAENTINYLHGKRDNLDFIHDAVNEARSVTKGKEALEQLEKDAEQMELFISFAKWTLGYAKNGLDIEKFIKASADWKHQIEEDANIRALTALGNYVQKKSGCQWVEANLADQACKKGNDVVMKLYFKNEFRKVQIEFHSYEALKAVFKTNNSVTKNDIRKLMYELYYQAASKSSQGNKENTTEYVTLAKEILKYQSDLEHLFLKVNNITNEDAIVKGSTQAKAKVYLKVGKKLIGSGKADNKGNFAIKIPKQKAETEITVTAKNQTGKEGKPVVKPVVYKKFPNSYAKKLTDKVFDAFKNSIDNGETKGYIYGNLSKVFTDELIDEFIANAWRYDGKNDKYSYLAGDSDNGYYPYFRWEKYEYSALPKTRHYVKDGKEILVVSQHWDAFWENSAKTRTIYFSRKNVHSSWKAYDFETKYDKGL